MRRRPTLLLVALAVVVGLGLCCWRLSWGLAAGAIFWDENFWVLRARSFASLSCHAFAVRELVYPTLYGYLTGLAGWLVTRLGAADAFGTDPTPIVLVARAVSAVAWGATVAVTGRLATTAYGGAAGVAAAWLLAVAPLGALQVHYASVDVLLSCWVTVALLAALALQRHPTWLRAALAGGAVGLAFASKYTGAAAGTAVAWAIAESWWRDRRARTILACAAAALVAFGAAVLVACPSCVLDPAVLWWAFTLLHGVATAGAVDFSNNHLTPAIGWWGQPWVYQLVASLPWGLGLPLWTLALVGLGSALRRRSAPDRLLLAFAVPYFAIVGAWRVTFPRYLLPLFPPLVVLAAAAVLRTGVRRPLAGAVLVAGVTAYTAALTISQVARFSLDQPLSVVAWVHAVAARCPPPLLVNVAAGFDTLGLRERIEGPGVVAHLGRDGHWLVNRPDVLVVPEPHAISLRRDHPEGAAAAELARLEAGTGEYVEARRWPPSWYLHRDFYVRLDPAFSGDIWQGGIGYRAYVRTDRPCALEG